MSESAFERWTKEAGEMLAARDYASAASAMFGALRALAAERAAAPRIYKYPAPGIPGGYLNLIHPPEPPEPRSYRHWGMH